MTAYLKDIWRTIKNGKKRFISLVLITALGVTTMTGLRASCFDLRHSADKFYDEQQLFDINVMSTLGLTDNDLRVLSDLEEIEKADGVYSEQVTIHEHSDKYTADIVTLSTNGMNIPYIIDGALPTADNEIAVVEKFAIESGKGIGDTVIIEEDVRDSEDEKANFKNKSFNITGIVTDPRDVNKAQGATAFRAAASSDYIFFVSKNGVAADIYTQIYLKVSGTEELQTYSDEYEERVQKVISVIDEKIKEQREQARYDSVIGEGADKIHEAEQEMKDEFAKAEDEFSRAWADINSGKNQLSNGISELSSKEKLAKNEIAKAKADINKGYSDLSAGQQKLDKIRKELEAGENELNKAKDELSKNEEKTLSLLNLSRKQLTDNRGKVHKDFLSLNSQSKSIIDSFGDRWPNEKWDAYINSSTKAYAPLIIAQMEAERLKKELSGLDKSSEDYIALKKKIDELNTKIANYEKEAVLQTEKAKEAFLQEFVPIRDRAIADIDNQISGLDITDENYKEQLALLNGKKKQLEELSASMPSMAVGIGRLVGTERAIDKELKYLDNKQKEAESGFKKGRQELDRQQLNINAGKKKVSDGYAEIVNGIGKLKEGELELQDKELLAQKEIAEGKKRIEELEKQLREGENALLANQLSYENEKREGQEKISDAKDKLNDLDMAKWYVQSRNSLSGYNNVDTDSSSIETLGTVFPFVFLIVAILICLTTITRKVEEERGLIGTYKALGFTNSEIRRKYLIFAFVASALGGLIGDLAGFIVLPHILFNIFGNMYSLPKFIYTFDFLYGISGVVTFVTAMVIATFFACNHELRQMPAALMRPKAPKAGSRVIFEYIPFMWNRLSFLNKVTARNLFRYKKRLLMTIFGIMGCTSLLVCGFAIKDSVEALLPNQYDWIYRYDMQAVVNEKDNDNIVKSLMDDDKVDKYLNIRMETATIKNKDGTANHLQIIVIPDGVSYDDFMYFENTDDKSIGIPSSGVLVTENTYRILGLQKGETAPLQNFDLEENNVVISDVVKNYLGNKVYMSQSVYEQAFGEYKANSVLINFNDKCKDQEAYAKDFGNKKGVMSSISVDTLRREFSDTFALVNVAVYIIISLAAGLAVVVLFTLSTTNISERERELATIKVLGFYNGEVHSYVNKETFILTFIGILMGLPLGRYLGGLMTNALKMPGVHFGLSIKPISYIYATIIAACFAVVVNIITNQILDRINPVSALKSVE